MTTSVQSTLHTPIIGKVTAFNNSVITYYRHLPEELKQYHGKELLKYAQTMFIQAYRQLNKKDYIKRLTELIEEAQSLNMLILAVKGYTNKEAAVLDKELTDILLDIYKLKNKS